MANFLDDLSIYNAKAAVAISNAVADRQYDRANMMSGLKATANDVSLTEAVRLNALTALINLGQLLDVPLAPYFPVSVTFGDTQTYQGIHNDLTGLQGGTAGEYYHLTQSQVNKVALSAVLGDITFANLLGVYTDNANLGAIIDSKQPQLNGTGFVKATGTTISYDNSTYLTNITGIAAGGELTGTYPNPALSNAAVIGKVLTGWNGTATPAAVAPSDSILVALQKINANLNQVIASPSGVASVGLTNNAGGVFTTTVGPLTGAVTLNLGLNTQNANLVLASGTASNGQQPAFRSLVVADLPSSGATPGNYGGAALIPQITVDAKGRITSISTVAAAGGGQVNSVSLSIPGSIFGAVSNTGTAADPILTFGLDTQTANYVWAGPVSGAAAVPAFRALVEDDIPALSVSKITNLTNILDGYLPDALANDMLFIGNVSSAAVNAIVTGDLTAAYVDNNGTNEAEFTIANGVVSYAKIQDVTSQTLLGRYALTNGVVQELTLNSSDFTINSSTGEIGLLTPNAPILTTKGDILTHTGAATVRLGIGADATIFMADTTATTGNKWVAVSGDATIATTGALTIANSAVTLAKMANLAANTVIGNNTGSSATPIALTQTQLTAMVNQFTTSLAGVVPAATNTGYFLRGDGTWQPVSGTGTVTTVSVATANGFSGSVANATTTPAITLSTSVNGLVKGNGTGVSAAVAGTDYISPGQITQTSGAGSGLSMASGGLLGRTTASAGPIESISVNSSLTLGSLTLGINLGNSNVWTAQQQMPSLRLNGSTSGFIVIQPPAVAGSQTYTLPTATPSAGQFLTGTGGTLSWATPVGSGVTTNAVTFNNSGSGAASGTTFDGSVARTISYNTIGAQGLNANLTGLSSLSYSSGTPFVKMTGAGTFSLDNNTYISGTTTQYAVLVGGAGNSIASITPSSSNKLLISNGVSTNPGWTAASYLNTTTQYGILYSSAANVVSEILPPLSPNLFLQWTGSGYTWAAGGGGGGSGTVTNVSVVTANGFSGSVANSTTTPAITLSTTETGVLKGSAGALVAATPGTDYLTSVGLTMPSAFTVTTSPLTANGTLAVTGAGLVSQYIRGDGSLANFPTSGGGGGSVNYYLNGSVTPSPNVVGYKQMSRVANTGAAANFTLTNTVSFQLMAEFVTDGGDPALLSIPAGSWNFSFYFSASNNSGNPQFYVELLKYDGTTFTSIATGTASPETITNGTTIDLYNTSITIPSSTALTLTDRLVIRVYVDTDGSRTITFYTQATRLAEVFTTFTTGLTALNGLTDQVQSFANGSSGTAPAFVSSTATHTLNIPLASTASVTAGLISNTDYTTFSNKMSNPMTTFGDIIYGGTVTSGVAAPTRLGGQTTNGTYFLRANVTASTAVAPDWLGSTGSGNVVLSTSPSLTTPNIGAATATSVNGLTLTSLSTGFSIAGGTSSKTLTMSNTLTFTGTDSSSIAFGAGGTVAYIGTANSWTAGVKQTFAPDATTAGINVGSLAGQPSGPANGDMVYNTSANALQAYINSAWVSLGAGGGGGITTLNTLTASTQTFAVGTTGTDFAISSATSTHTFNLPDASATARGVVTTGTQTIAGAKTFTGSTLTILTSTSTQDGIVLQARNGGSSSHRLTITTAALTGSRIYTIPEVSASADFVMSAGTQTVGGAKTFSSILASNVSGSAISILSNSRYSYTAAGSEVLAMDSVTIGGGAYAWRLLMWNGSTAVEQFRIQNFSPGFATDIRMGFGTSSPTYKIHVKDNATGTSPMMLLDSVAKSSLTASTEFNNVQVNNTYTWTWLTGNITTQRHFLVTAPTYAFNGASTITSAATFAISAAPTAGTNATITNSYALWVQAGATRLDGNFGFGVAPAASQSGGAQTASTTTYGTTEADMLQKAYNALRTFGFLS